MLWNPIIQMRQRATWSAPKKKMLVSLQMSEPYDVAYEHCQHAVARPRDDAARPLKCPPGYGPRQCVFNRSSDGTHCIATSATTAQTPYSLPVVSGNVSTFVPPP